METSLPSDYFLLLPMEIHNVQFLLTEPKPETLKWPSVDMFVHEARRNTFRESRNARMSAMEKSKSVGNALLNPPKLIPAAFGVANP